KALGPEHPDTAASVNNLAMLYYDTGAYAQAEPLHRRALAIREKVLGPEHPNTATSLNNLAVLYWAQARWAEAEASMERSVSIEESNARSILALGDESRKRAHAATLAGSTAGAVAFSLGSLGDIPGVRQLGLEVVLQRKGRVQDVMADSFAAVRSSLSASDR